MLYTLAANTNVILLFFTALLTRLFARQGLQWRDMAPCLCLKITAHLESTFAQGFYMYQLLSMDPSTQPAFRPLAKNARSSIVQIGSTHLELIPSTQGLFLQGPCSQSLVYFTLKYQKFINALHDVVDDLGRFFADAFAFDKTRAPTGEVHEIIPLAFRIALIFLD
jgi:hypothetical protein